jgi:hypothetical protein
LFQEYIDKYGPKKKEKEKKEELPVVVKKPRVSNKKIVKVITIDDTPLEDANIESKKEIEIEKKVKKTKKKDLIV